MKKLMLFVVLLAAVLNVSAMDLSQWLSDENRANKTTEQIERDARMLVEEGKMTQDELELVLASIKN